MWPQAEIKPTTSNQCSYQLSLIWLFSPLQSLWSIRPQQHMPCQTVLCRFLSASPLWHEANGKSVFFKCIKSIGQPISLRWQARVFLSTAIKWFIASGLPLHSYIFSFCHKTKLFLKIDLFLCIFCCTILCNVWYIQIVGVSVLLV